MTPPNCTITTSSHTTATPARDKLKLVPESPLDVHWKTISNIKHLMIVLEQFSLSDTIDIDRDGCVQAIADMARMEVEKIEDLLS